MSGPGDAKDQVLSRLRALTRLPPAYATALRMRDAGHSLEAIARQVGVEPEAVDALLAIAEAKLATILTSTEPE